MMWKKVLLPLLVVALAVLGAVLMVETRPEVEVVEQEILPPLVRAVTARERSLRLDVSSQGTVLPRTEADLVAEVAGRIVWVAPDFEPGGFFAAGEVLVRLDERDYELARAAAEAQVAQARVRVAREEAEAEIAREEWKDLGQGDATPLVLREPQLQEARAALAAAEATLARSELDLQRTRIRAPFAGRVRSKEADVGGFVNRGASLARVYAVDYVEVRLPVPDEELRFLDLVVSYADAQRAESGPPVTLSSEFAGRHNEWRGRIVRTEGEIDRASRMVHLVARVEEPYAHPQDGLADRLPLAVGLFVNASIEGRVLDGLVELPRAAMRGDDRLLVIDEEGRLRYRTVAVLRRTRETVILSGGVHEGEQVCVSPIEAPVDGMRVRALASEAADAESGLPSAGSGS